MWVLDFLSDPGWKGTSHRVNVEYRLVSSGVLYNGDVLTTDWIKTDATRLISRKPITLLVASRPIDSYPQELMLRFTSAPVTQKIGTYQSIFSPDREICKDVCALLTIFCR